MRIFRYVLMLCGNELKSAALTNELIGDYAIHDEESIGSIADNSGVISVAPTVDAVVDEDYSRVNTYNTWFPRFLETNHSLFAKHGVDDIRIFMEVFYATGQQCNLEIFDRELIFRIAKFNVALPISIHALKEDAMTKWAKEIDQAWLAAF